MNSIKHDVIMNNNREIIIKKVLIKKYSFYYEFEKVLRDLLIVTLSFTIKFIRLDSLSKETYDDNTKN
jgi:hypothetical protein